MIYPHNQNNQQSENKISNTSKNNIVTSSTVSLNKTDRSAASKTDGGRKIKVHISAHACKSLIDYLGAKGYVVNFTEPLAAVAEPIAMHPDIIMCKLGVSDESPVFHGDPLLLEANYPKDVRYNACCTGKYFIHNLKYTDTELLRSACGFSSHNSENPQTAEARAKLASAASAAGGRAAAETPNAENANCIPINVPQGYAKCSIVSVNENSVITYDDGIAKACLKTGLDVLHISSGHILLPGYPTGFIGGCSGRIGNEIIFNGDLSLHPNFTAIRDFIESRELTCTWFDDCPLTDIGSIICECE